MRVKKKIWAAGLLACIVMAESVVLGGFGAITSRAAGRADVSPSEGGPGCTSDIVPEDLSAAASADQLIVVVGTGGCRADISYYKKNGESWKKMWKEAGYVGRNGITADKAEGDGATPEGIYRFDLAFGLLDDPGSNLPYHKIEEGDFWIDDPSSSFYNQLVNTERQEKDWNSGENLMEASPYYNYALSLTYNQERIPGKGSAIFLHCFKTSEDKASSGCICLPEERVKELLEAVTEDTMIVIARDREHLR